MVKFDALKDFDVAALGQSATGQALQLPVAKIEYDPDNIRSAQSLDPVQLQELASTIESQGLVQPISVRHHPQKSDRYIVNAGERRLRAVQSLGHITIAAFIQDDFDPYLQAIENLQREALHPLDIARFVAAREAAGDSRATIAKRLGKSKSFISEVAHLSSAPAAIVQAFKEDRIDTRTAYLLARRYREDPNSVTECLAGEARLTRGAATRALAIVSEAQPAVVTERRIATRVPRTPVSSWNALSVAVGERVATMNLRPGKRPNQATVTFADGSEETVALSKIALKHWILL
jgi:ParB family chromosome partitioning protein